MSINVNSGKMAEGYKVEEMTLEEVYRLAGIDIGPTYEKKYIISMVDLELLKNKYNTETVYVERTYLNPTEENVERVIKYTSTIDKASDTVNTEQVNQQNQTNKNKIDRYYYIENCTSIDIYKDDTEKEIGIKDYNRLKQEIKPNTHPLKRKRIKFVYQGTYFEIDIYPFWSDKAILKVEKSNGKDEPVSLPKEIKILSDITGDQRYKLRNLAINLGNIA